MAEEQTLEQKKEDAIREDSLEARENKLARAILDRAGKAVTDNSQSDELKVCMESYKLLTDSSLVRVRAQSARRSPRGRRSSR